MNGRLLVRADLRTDHTTLASVPKDKEPEGQLARSTEFISYEMEYRVGLRHGNTDALSRSCKWCEEWKKDEQMVNDSVQTDVLSAMCGEFVA